MPGWAWEAKNKQGHFQSGWTSGSEIATREDLLAHLRVHYHALDYTDFKCEQKDQAPLIVKPVPAAWYEFGTTRFRQEIDAGLRPFSQYLQPPLQLTERNEGLIPTSQKKLKPTWRKQ